MPSSPWSTTAAKRAWPSSKVSHTFLRLLARPVADPDRHKAGNQVVDADRRAALRGLRLAHHGDLRVQRTAWSVGYEPSPTAVSPAACPLLFIAVAPYPPAPRRPSGVPTPLSQTNGFKLRTVGPPDANTRPRVSRATA